MTIKSTAATLGAALILAGAPALASAATVVTAPSPIRLDSVQIAPYYGQFDNYFPGLITVAFTNESAKPVTGVVFDLESNGNVIRRYHDKTTLAQGASIKHAFSDTNEASDKNLAVESVTFADGTVWNNTDAVPSRRQSQAAQAGVSTDMTFPEYN
jgi:hypothetical protein